MARNRGKKALYEVMSKARTRQSYGKSLERMHSKKIEEEKPAAKPSKAVADWWKKPKIAQFNAGRFEFSIPYQAAIALGLLFVLLLLGSYRLGQNSIVSIQATNDITQEPETVDPESSKGLETANIEQPSPPTEKIASNQDTTPVEDVTPDVKEEVKPEKPKGNNVIVLVQFGKMADLVPVQQHFAEHGIETEIKLRGDQYFLETVERYNNPANPGSDGFEAKKEIRRVGALYKGKAPPGLETFETHLFRDAYGRKVED